MMNFLAIPNDKNTGAIPRYFSGIFFLVDVIHSQQTRNALNLTASNGSKNALVWHQFSFLGVAPVFVPWRGTSFRFQFSFLSAGGHGSH